MAKSTIRLYLFFYFFKSGKQQDFQTLPGRLLVTFLMLEHDYKSYEVIQEFFDFEFDGKLMNGFEEESNMIRCIFLLLNFEIVIDSYAVIGNNIKRSCVLSSQCPPMVASYKTIEQYHNQDIDIDSQDTEHF